MAFTVTVDVAVEAHPLVVPVTVYTVVVAGDTGSVDVVAPVFQEYVEAPVTASVVELPEQIVVEVATTLGVAVTVMVCVEVLVPNWFVATKETV